MGPRDILSPALPHCPSWGAGLTGEEQRLRNMASEGGASPSRLGLGALLGGPPAARPPHALLPAQPLPCRALLPVKPVPRQPSRFSLDSVAVGVPFRSPPT